MKQPNFFVVGAPKCGTTALCEYLSSHPNVYLSPIKEPHYFADEFESDGIDSWQAYQDLFKDANSEHFKVGEGSTHYLFSSTALQNIYRYDRAARIVAMLRNPIDLVYSYHFQLIYNLDEDEEDFEAAWRLQTLRAQGKRIPKFQKNPLVLQYKALGSLGSQVEKLLQIFPADQVKLILFDDFKRSPKEVYKEILSFLDLSDDHRTSFPKVNASRKHRFQLLGRLIEEPPHSLANLVSATKKVLGVKSLGIGQLAREANLERFERPPLTDAFRAELFQEFESEIDKLSTLIARDLSGWRPS